MRLWNYTTYGIWVAGRVGWITRLRGRPSVNLAHAPGATVHFVPSRIPEAGRNECECPSEVSGRLRDRRLGHGRNEQHPDAETNREDLMRRPHPDGDRNVFVQEVDDLCRSQPAQQFWAKHSALGLSPASSTRLIRRSTQGTCVNPFNNSAQTLCTPFVSNNRFPTSTA